MHIAVEVIAQVARVDAATLTTERRLDSLGLSASLGLSILRSGLNRRLGCNLGPLNWWMTIADVLAALDGGGVAQSSSPTANTPRTPAATAKASGPFGGPRRAVSAAPALPLHGVDLEDIATLPEWPASGAGAAFYDEHFTAEELARAAQQSNPRATLCGYWCAKEAVKKCAPELLALGWKDIEIAVAADGRPSVVISRIPEWLFSLSISHSAASAAASVLALRR